MVRRFTPTRAPSRSTRTDGLYSRPMAQSMRRTNPQNDTGAWTRLSGNCLLSKPARVGYDAVGKRLITAAQDNGVTIQSARNAPLWNAVQGADGINAFVNDVTLAATGRSVFYGEYSRPWFHVPNHHRRAGQLRQSEYLGLGSRSYGHLQWHRIATTSRQPGRRFGSPWVNNRVDPTRMAFGGDSVYVTQDTLTGAQEPAANTVDLTLTDLGSYWRGICHKDRLWHARQSKHASRGRRGRALAEHHGQRPVRLFRCPATRRPEASHRPAWCSIPDRSSDISWPITRTFSAPRTKAHLYQSHAQSCRPASSGPLHSNSFPTMASTR